MPCVGSARVIATCAGGCDLEQRPPARLASTGVRPRSPSRRLRRGRRALARSRRRRQREILERDQPRERVGVAGDVGRGAVRAQTQRVQFGASRGIHRHRPLAPRYPRRVGVRAVGPCTRRSPRRFVPYPESMTTRPEGTPVRQVRPKTEGWQQKKDADGKPLLQFASPKRGKPPVHLADLTPDERVDEGQGARSAGLPREAAREALLHALDARSCGDERPAGGGS